MQTHALLLFTFFSSFAFHGFVCLFLSQETVCLRKKICKEKLIEILEEQDDAIERSLHASGNYFSKKKMIEILEEQGDTIERSYLLKMAVERKFRQKSEELFESGQFACKLYTVTHARADTDTHIHKQLHAQIIDE